MEERNVVVIGGTSGIGLELARRYADRGSRVVISGRDAERAALVAKELGERTTALALDLSEPKTLAPGLADVDEVDRLVLAAIDRDKNSVREYDIDRAIRLVTLKLVGYTEVVHTLASRLSDDAAVLLFGGLAKERPYPGSTTVTTVNAGVTGMVRTLVHELAPVRVNGIHPAIVGDSPFWAANPAAVEAARERTLTKRGVAMADVVDAAAFLLENPAMNGVDLFVDAGWALP